MNYLGDFPEDFTTVAVYFTTYNNQGAPVAPSSAYVVGDVKIYKNGSATEKTSTNGLTMTSPFDSIVGLHRLLIDTSNDTGDAAFWVTGALYSVILSSTKTVGGQASLKEIASFGICLAPAIRPTTAGRTLTVTSSGQASINWADVANPTTALALTGTTIASTQKVDIETIKTNPVVNGGTITFATNTTVANTTGAVGSVTGSVGSVTGLTASNLDATVSSRLAAGSYTAPSNLTAAQIATGIWQDATAGDFTTAGSIGRSLFTSGVLPGAAGGLFIAGTNAATTITTALTTTFTGNLTGSVASVTGLTASDVGSIKAKTDNLPALPASTTNITAGTVTTVSGNVTGSVGSVTGLTASDVGAIKLKTDSLTFTVAAKLDVNCLYVNGIQVTGAGTSGNPWGPA